MIHGRIADGPSSTLDQDHGLRGGANSFNDNVLIHRTTVVFKSVFQANKPIALPAS